MKKKRPKNSYHFIIGLSLIALGIVITVLTYALAENSGGGTYIIMYGPILAGLSMVLRSPNNK